MISMIAAVGKNLELGKNNNLIWNIKEDMRYFKEMTYHHTVIVGYNTFQSFPNGLPNRKIIVITDENVDNEEKRIESTIDVDGLINKYINSEEEIFIIGGASIYSQFLPYARRLYLTEIDSSDKDADTFFPKFIKDEWKKKVVRESSSDDVLFKMCIYNRKDN